MGRPLHNAPSNLKNAMLPEGIALARERRAAFKELIRGQPKLALAETVPALVRNELPESILELLENRVTGKGDFMALGEQIPSTMRLHRAGPSLMDGNTKRSFMGTAFLNRRARMFRFTASLLMDNSLSVTARCAFSNQGNRFPPTNRSRPNPARFPASRRRRPKTARVRMPSPPKAGLTSIGCAMAITSRPPPMESARRNFNSPFNRITPVASAPRW